MIKRINYFSSLRFKLVGAAIVIEVIMLSILIWNSMRLIENNLTAQLTHRVQQLRPLLNASLAGPLLQEDLATLNEIVQQFVKNEIHYLAIYNTENEQIVMSGTPPVANSFKALADSSSQTLWMAGNRALLQMPIQLSGQEVGYLLLKMDIDFIEQAITSIRSQSGIIAAIEILLSIILLSLVGYALTQNLQSLTHATQSMAEGDLSVRTRINSSDEVGVAAETFNLMAERISEDQQNLYKRDNEITQLNEQLEQRVEKRTHQLQEANNALQSSLEELQQTQHKLVESEKMAALGGLVAGIAHEINTPVGVSVTAASHLAQKIKKYAQQYHDNTLTREDFESLIALSDNSSNIILSNLERAVGLIRSFKQIAVDQTSDVERHFNLKSYFSEILLSLEPELKKYEPSIEINGGDIELNSYPGAISQIFTNLVMNSLIHGFEDMEKRQGCIEIDVTTTDQQVSLSYCDNGKGIPEEKIKRIFEPFYTTKRNQGGSGLGMHIVYNLVTKTLSGNIEYHNQPGGGACFLITIPNH